MTAPVAAAVGLTAALIAWRLNTLSPAGALAAAALGMLLLWATGWSGGAMLLAFYGPSSIVGRVTLRRPSAGEAREEVRSAVQVLANGAPAALGGLAELTRPGLGLWIVAGSLAAASADTWATSIGRLSRNEPRLLGTGRRVPRGTSGGVSLAGTLGGAAGAAVVATSASLLLDDPALFGVAFIIGWGGMFLDSVLGVTAQAWSWLDNDGVNAVTTATAAVASALAWSWR